MLDTAIEVDFGNNETLLARGESVSFSKRFRCSQFQNTYGKRNELIDSECLRTIGLVMKLRYPFVVELK